MPYCSSCGSEVTSDLRFCPNCGKELQSRTGSSLDIERPRHPRSAWWYLLPIIFGIIGGIIAYFVLRDDDKKLAKNCLWLGIILSIIGCVIGLIIGAVVGINHVDRYY